MKNNKGFTLVELLVVVLIVGILSAIALPQYQKAVEKANLTEALINAKAIVDASQRYFQAFPDETTVTSKSQIADVDLRGGAWLNNSTYYTSLFVYKLGGENGAVTVYRTDAADGTTTDYDYYFTVDIDNHRTCTPKTPEDEPKCKQVLSYGNQISTSSGSSGGAPNPTPH